MSANQRSAASGKNADRAGLLAALDYMREGDTLTVWRGTPPPPGPHP
ncbi:hypothetical protein ACFC09_08375 [Streptomyces sp. NPDC056161]